MRHQQRISNINYQGPFGNTLLHGAVIGGDVHETERLLKLGANPMLRNREGRSAIDAARLLERREIETLLMRARFAR